MDPDAAEEQAQVIVGDRLAATFRITLIRAKSTSPNSPTWVLSHTSSPPPNIQPNPFVLNASVCVAPLIVSTVVDVAWW